MPVIDDHPSPNHSARSADCSIDKLVLHYTEEPLDVALDKLCDPEAEVSAHYLVAADGRIFSLVPEERNAWHAGKAHWRGSEKVNSSSIGIELDNPGDAPFPPAQMEALAALSHDILSRHDIPAYNVVGHSDVAPGRKNDPGTHFDWKRLAEQGIGHWPEQTAPKEWDGDVERLQHRLAKYGYGVPQTGELCEATQACIDAFQQHFRPEKCDGRWDAECEGKLDSLLEKTRTAVMERRSVSQRAAGGPER